MDDDNDPDLICAILANAGCSQDEIDELAPSDCSNYWLSKRELRRRMGMVYSWPEIGWLPQPDLFLPRYE